ncbi:hypothetical protein SFRURICE_007068 [Spodoptera frugiperda]|nr:hypothetical protein SFRURICE_007068 [Spodoptera frugiperda]
MERRVLWIASLLSIHRILELCIFLAQLHSLVSVETSVEHSSEGLHQVKLQLQTLARSPNLSPWAIAPSPPPPNAGSAIVDLGRFSTRDVLCYVAVDAFGFYQSYSFVHIA